MKIKLKMVERNPGFLGLWVQLPDRSWKCGNVLVANVGGWGLCEADWRVFLIDRAGQIQGPIQPVSRPWGYGHAGQAKIGASLMSRYRKEFVL